MNVAALIPIHAVSVANLREHWAAKARRAKVHRETACIALMAASKFGRYPHDRMPPEALFEVTLTRVGCKRLDSDNLASALKACRDGVADWLMLDDADPRISWRYAQEQDRNPCVRVDIIRREA